MKEDGQAFNEESIGAQPLPPGDSKARRNIKGNDVGARVTAASNSAREEEEGEGGKVACILCKISLPW